MKAYPLFLLTLLASSFAPKGNITPVYAEGDSSPSTITITPTGLNSCEVNGDTDVIATYLQSGTNASEVANLSKDGHAIYDITGLDSINITRVSFSAQGSWNPYFSVNYSLNRGDTIEKSTNFQSLYGAASSDGYIDLVAPFEYPIENAEEFRFELKTTTGTIYVQSVTITYEEEMDPFAKAMLSDLTCDESGATPPSVEEWNAAKDTFETLSVEEQGKYKDAQADANGDTYQRVVAKYDYILSKYGTEEYANFLGRQTNESSAVIRYDASDLIALLSLVVIGMVAAGSFLFVKKRKI